MADDRFHTSQSFIKQVTIPSHSAVRCSVQHTSHLIITLLQHEFPVLPNLGNTFAHYVFWRFHNCSGDGDFTWDQVRLTWCLSSSQVRYRTKCHDGCWLCQAIIQLFSYPSKELIFDCRNCPKKETSTSQQTLADTVTDIYNLQNSWATHANFCWGFHMSVCKSTGGGGGGRCFCSDRQGNGLQVSVSLD